ncbi:MAG: beta-galactosidase/beta-glucuronidase, partial [Glaciecola sp.]
MQPVFAQAIKVEIVENNGKYTLLRGGEPYIVKGVGTVDTNFERAAKYGANSIRTWSVDSNAMPALALLDRAHALGMTVSLGLEFARERHGFDYNDSEAVAKQFEESRERVMKYKDHPALLTWIIGNEVNINYSNPKVFDAINQVAEMIKEVDPNHPTTTALAGFDKRALGDIAQRAA